MIYVRTQKNPPPGTRRPTGDASWHVAMQQVGYNNDIITRCGKYLTRYEQQNVAPGALHLCKSCTKAYEPKSKKGTK